MSYLYALTNVLAIDIVAKANMFEGDSYDRAGVGFSQIKVWVSRRKHSFQRPCRSNNIGITLMSSRSCLPSGK
jgi:hypothetical protein